MLQIDDFYKLNALLGAMLTLKFEMPVSDPDVREMVASTLLASVLKDTYEATIDAAQKMGNESFARGLIEARTAASHPRELQKAHEHVNHAAAQWNEWSHQQKSDFLAVVLSPYEVDEALCDAFISECDSPE